MFKLGNQQKVQTFSLNVVWSSNQNFEMLYKVPTKSSQISAFQTEARFVSDKYCHILPHQELKEHELQGPPPIVLTNLWWPMIEEKRYIVFPSLLYSKLEPDCKLF